MKYLIASDLHLTDRPRDAYRFDLFPWLQEMATENEVDYIFILGDVTDKKDNHSSKLVNQIVNAFEGLSKVAPTLILTGNHDYIDVDCPFFHFLNALPSVQFLNGISEFKSEDGNLLFLSHTRTPTEDWKDIKWSEFKYVFMHQTMDGAKASTGIALDGLSRKIFRGFKGTIISGDIHVPQDVGPVTYVGSPYHVHFGDHFLPRCMLIDTDYGRIEDLYFDAPRKLTYEITDPEDLKSYDFESRDQLKVRLKLRAADLADWSVLKGQVEEICKERGTYLHAVELIKVGQKKSKKDSPKLSVNLSHGEAYERFCKKEGIKGSMKEIGQSLLE